MEEFLKELSQRMERIEENQKLILEELSHSIIYPNNIQKERSAKTKKEKEREQIEEYIAI
ncbi:hypothetical protein RM553_17600 [Zunongwangia sp. F363]|uniref:Uncharacterized protein n=1 Tax=Autumnicola tepida TaxID=3075595 RepID=A0ABU3CE85_9FLAO|nr:hypothetical protein [Zunongwangia sp. F363]MDT0644659.1 hypothetical protein [Zunongwangia sp. F363]